MPFCFELDDRELEEGTLSASKGRPWFRGHRLDPWLEYLPQDHAGALIPSPDRVPSSLGQHWAVFRGWELEDIMYHFNYVLILSHVPKRPC